MLRVKAMCVIPGNAATERLWRESRAQNLAEFMAWRRLPLNSQWRERLRRIIVEDIIPDIGWPRFRWLKREVRRRAASLRAFREEHGL